MCKKVKLPEDKNGLTRRDFLAKTSQAMMGMALMPSFLRGLSPTAAFGAAPTTPVAHVTFDLFQGDSLISYFPAMDLKGSSLPAAGYASHGFDPALLSASGGINTTWGAPIANTGGGSVTINGTAVNNIVTMLTNAKIPGSVQFATLAAVHNNDVGQYYLASELVSSFLNPASPFKVVTNPPKGGGIQVQNVAGYTPIQVNSVTAYQSLLGPVGPMTAWTQNQQVAAAALANSMSARQMNAVQNASADGSSTLATSMMHGYNANQTTLGSAATVPDPRTDTRVSGPFALTTATAVTAPQAVLASLVKMVLDGQTQTIRFTPAGNFDVHTISGQTEYQQLMGVFSTLIIPTIQTFVAQKVPFWIDITTDGSANWNKPLTSGGTTQADDDGISMQVSIAYNPAIAKPLVSTFANGYAATGNVVTGSATPHVLGQGGLPTTEINTALLRAASAIKLLTGTDPTGNSVFSPIAGFLLT